MCAHVCALVHICTYACTHAHTHTRGHHPLLSPPGAAPGLALTVCSALARPRVGSLVLSSVASAVRQWAEPTLRGQTSSASSVAEAVFLSLNGFCTLAKNASGRRGGGGSAAGRSAPIRRPAPLPIVPVTQSWSRWLHDRSRIRGTDSSHFVLLFQVRFHDSSAFAFPNKSSSDLVHIYRKKSC